MSNHTADDIIKILQRAKQDNVDPTVLLKAFLSAKPKKVEFDECIGPILENVQTFQDTEGGMYASVKSNLIVPINNKEVEKYIYAEFRRFTGRTMSELEWKKTLKLLSHQAIDQERIQSRYRIHYDPVSNTIYLDKGSSNKCLKISTDEIEEVNWPSDIIFLRHDRTRELGKYDLKGTKEDLIRPWASFPTHVSDLVTAWLLKSLLLDGDNTHLTVCGPTTSGKSTISNMLTALIDPRGGLAEDAEKSYPGNAQDLATHLSTGYVIPYGNRRDVPDDLSDNLSPLATGGSLSVRLFYFQGREFSAVGKRLVIITAVNYPIKATSSDLAGRFLKINLPGWREDNQPPVITKIWEEFHKNQPLMLGALYKTMQTVLRNRQRNERTISGRLDGLCQVGEASGLWPSGYITKLVTGNAGETQNTLTNEDPILSALIEVCKRYPNEMMRTTYANLAAHINEYTNGSPKVVHTALSRHMKNNEGPLLKRGLQFVKAERRSEGQYLCFLYTPPVDEDEGDILKGRNMPEPGLDDSSHLYFRGTRIS